MSTTTRNRASNTRYAVLAGPPIVVFVLLIGAWYGAAAYYDQVRGLSYLVPYPHQVLHAMFLNADVRPQLLNFLWQSIQVSVVGLAIAAIIGMAWAVVMAQAKWLEHSLFPYAVILQCVPILALVPLIGMLAGYGFPARVIVTVMIALFPMVANTLFGLRSADTAQQELFALQNAGRLTRLKKLYFPAALPSIFVGLRSAAGLSVVGAIVGDQFFQRGTPGLGVAIQLFASRLSGPEMYAAIITSSLYGVAVFLLFGYISKKVVGKWHD